MSNRMTELRKKAKEFRTSSKTDWILIWLLLVVTIVFYASFHVNGGTCSCKHDCGKHSECEEHHAHNCMSEK